MRNRLVRSIGIIIVGRVAAGGNLSAIGITFFALDSRQDLTDLQRVLDAFVDDELQSRRMTSLDAAGNLALQETGRILQPAKRKLLLLFVAHDADRNFRLAQVGADRYAHDSHVADTRITKFGKNRRSNDFSNRFSCFQQTSTGHERDDGLVVSE